ncbi:MAG: hypothetical protein ABI193_05300 [Minicystis sp.]
MKSARGWGLTWASALLAASGACGSSVSGSTNPLTTGTGSASGTSDATTGAGAGSSVSSGTSGSGGQVVGEPVALVVRKLYLGDTNPDGTPNKLNGWKQFGYNLDGKVSTASSQDLCQPYGGATAKNVYPDGDNGIDNSFGKNLLPIFQGIASDFSGNVNKGITQGKSTATIFELTNLGSGSDQGSLLGRFYVGVPLGKPPLFNGDDVWPIAKSSLTDPAIPSSAKVTFSDGSLSGDIWFSHAEGGSVRIDMGGGFAITLDILDAVVDIHLDPAHASATGTIAGVLDAAAFGEEFRKAAGSFDPSLCSGPTIESIINQVRQASDILKNGKQDPNQECSGISIGLGFEAALVKLGDPAALPVSPDPCK